MGSVAVRITNIEQSGNLDCKDVAEWQLGLQRLSSVAVRIVKMEQRGL